MNAFETLGLKENAPEDDIRRAYHSLAKQCHPDLFTDSAEQAAAQLRRPGRGEPLRGVQPRKGHGHGAKVLRPAPV